MSYLNNWVAVGMLGVVSVLIPLGMMFVSWLLRPSVPAEGKRSTYESGEIPTGTTRIRFNIQYYMVALLFVVFDIETVLIFPWTVIYRDAVGTVGMTKTLVPMLVFIGVLVVGLAWAWRNGAVEWARSPQADRQRTGVEERRRDRRRPGPGPGGAGTGSGRSSGPGTGPGTGTGSTGSGAGSGSGTGTGTGGD